MNTIYTIGHSSYPLEQFLMLLKKYSINSVVDVRSVPFSRYVPYYNKDDIRRFLSARGIHCIYMGKELGAIREDRSLYSENGFLDFNKVQQDPLFKEGINRLVTGIDKGYTISIMCTEKDPIDCHRSIIIGKVLHSLHFEVRHILDDSSFETQEQLESRLINIYFNNDSQINFLDVIDEQSSLADRLAKAYELRNKDIGHKPPK